MRSHVETFHANKTKSWQLLFLYQFRCFQNRNLCYDFQTLFTQKRSLASRLYFLRENESSQRFLSYETTGKVLVQSVKF